MKVCVFVCVQHAHHSLLHVRVRFNCDKSTPHVEQTTTGARHLKGDKLAVIDNFITYKCKYPIQKVLKKDI